MLPDFVTIHNRTLAGFDIITAKERECVADKFIALRDLPRKKWAKEGVRQGKGAVYFTHATDDLLFFFSVLPGRRFVLEDLVRQGRLDAYFSTPPEPASKI